MSHAAIMAMTWEQIGLYADLVQRRQLDVLNLTLVPLVTVQGGKRWKGYTVKRRRLSKGAPRPRSDAALLGGLGALGFRVGAEGPPKPGGG